ncbi:hypothetical protein M8994_10120 [Brucella sp. 21LCYQ03]|nr:hypothetical protein [Brucella sp. 21LCYQ03]
MLVTKIIVNSSILVTLSSYAFAEAPGYELHGSFGGARADAVSVSANGKVFGVRRMSSTGPYDKSFIVTPDGVADIGSLIEGGATALMAVSANGIAATGISSANPTDSHAFWWTEETGMRDIGTLGGTASYANGISYDGNVVAGDSHTAGNSATNAFRWTPQDGLMNLGTLGGESSFANAVSSDGSTIVGYSTIQTFESRAYRWTQASGMFSLGTLGGNNSTARGVSSDGSVVVGTSDTVDNGQHAFRWTSQTGMVDIHSLLGSQQSIADLVSHDGNVVAGTAIFDDGSNQAFRWTAQIGMISLDSLGSGLSQALSMTVDGNTLVGYSYTDTMLMRAFRWTEHEGMVDLGTIGGTSAVAWDISEDGTVIAGMAETADGNHHATLWKFPKREPIIEPVVNPGTPPTEPGPEPKPETGGETDQGTIPDEQLGSGPTPTPFPTEPALEAPVPAIETPVIIDVDHTVATVLKLANIGFSAMEAQRLTLSKLQGVCNVDQAGKTCYTQFTDFNGFGDQKDLLSGLTLGHGFTENFSAGLTMAHSFWRQQPDGYNSGSDNFGGGAYAQWQDKTPSGEWYMRFTLAANRYDADIMRPRLDYTEAGTGESRVEGWSSTLEAGRTENLSFNNARFGYYGGLRYSDVTMNGYTETNAEFPFTYSNMTYRLTTVYAGANYSAALNNRLRWSANIEIEQDLSHDDPQFNARADYIGGLSFNSDFAHTRGSASTSLIYAINDTVDLSFTPYLIRTATRENALGATARVSGRF